MAENYEYVSRDLFFNPDGSRETKYPKKYSGLRTSQNKLCTFSFVQTETYTDATCRPISEAHNSGAPGAGRKHLVAITSRPPKFIKKEKEDLELVQMVSFGLWVSLKVVPVR